MRELKLADIHAFLSDRQNIIFEFSKDNGDCFGKCKSIDYIISTGEYIIQDDLETIKTTNYAIEAVNIYNGIEL